MEPISRARTTSLRLAAAAGSIALALGLGGCAAISDLFGGGAPDRDEETGQVKEGGDVDVFELAVGDCLNLGEDGELTAAAVVPCDEEHTEEIYHEFALPDGDWPGDDELSKQAEEGCYSAFEGFAGIAYEDSTLGFFTLTPTEAGWTDESIADRLVQCVVYEPDESGDSKPLTGSLKGAAR